MFSHSIFVLFGANFLLFHSLNKAVITVVAIHHVICHHYHIKLVKIKFLFVLPHPYLTHPVSRFFCRVPGEVQAGNHWKFAIEIRLLSLRVVLGLVLVFAIAHSVFKSLFNH